MDLIKAKLKPSSPYLNINDIFIFHKAEIYIPIEFILRFYYQKV